MSIIVIHNAIQTRGTKLSKQAKTLWSALDTVFTPLERNVSHKVIKTTIEPLHQAYLDKEGMLRDIIEFAELDK